MRIPQRIIHGVVTGLAWPLNVYQSYASLNKSTRQQNTLPPAISPIAITNFVGFVLDGKGSLSLSRRHQVERLLLIGIVKFQRRTRLGNPQLILELIEQSFTTTKPQL